MPNQPKPEPMPPPLAPAEEPDKPPEPHTRHQPEPDQKGRRDGGRSPKGGSSDKVVFDEDKVAK
jgi:hypothetical protein